MKGKVLLLLSIYFLSATAKAQVNVDQVFTHAQAQTELMLQEIELAQNPAQPSLLMPRSLTNTGELKLIPTKDWTSGFFAGNLWFLYEYTRDEAWRLQAQTFTAKLASEQFDTGTHDVGFKIYNSYGAGYRLTQTPAYRNVIVQTAQSLSTRFNPKVGCIKSWDGTTKWTYPVIIDNMMNLELLFAATRLTGDSSYYKIADSHASTTLKNHYRTDNSSWHVVDYNPTTGQVLQKTTHQGYSDASAWARGQAWGLYGFTMCYRETKKSSYLAHAEKIAAFILNHPNLPADEVPYWDFNAPLTTFQPRDASAAALMASALYELSTYSAQGATYRAAADKIMESLAGVSYTSSAGQNRGFILDHSTGHKPAGTEIDVPLMYADYYYLEALLRKKVVNTPPVIQAIDSLTVTVGKPLAFSATATDANAGQTKTFYLMDAPAGATINPTTGVFNWTPNQPGTYSFYVKVADSGSPILTTDARVIVSVNPVYTLNVTTVGSGTVTKSPNQANYPSGTSVTLTAVAAAGYQFSGWSNGATGTTNPLTVSMTGNKNITATFTVSSSQQVTWFNLINADTNQALEIITEDEVLNLATLPPNLNIQAITNPTAVGSVKFALSGPQTRNTTETGAPYALFGDVSGNYNSWVPIVGAYTLTGTPYTSGGGGGTAGKSLTLHFSVVNQPVVAQYSLNIAALNGSVTKSPNQESYAEGTAVTLTATPAAGYQFSNWSGDIASAANPVVVTMSQNRNITANFTPEPASSYDLTVTTAGNGTVTKTPNQTSYSSGANVTLTATPAVGYQFSGWSGAASGTVNPLTVTMTANKSITATFTAASAGQQVISLTLMNAANDQPIRNLVPGEVINLASLPSKLINVRANTNPVTVGSVVFRLSGTQARNTTETGAPYALFGDTNGNYNPWEPATGNYTLTATPFTASGGSGTAGTPLTLNFSVVNQAATKYAPASAFPTPTTTGQVRVKLDAVWQGKITYTLVSATGTKLATGEIDAPHSATTLDFDFSRPMAAAGVYYLQLQSEGKTVNLTLMRQ